MDAESRNAVLITEAQPSLQAQQKARVHKYLAMMAFRVPALVIAGIVYGATHNGLLALAIVAISIPIPWIAVLIANDRPPKGRHEVRYYKYGPPSTPNLETKKPTAIEGEVSGTIRDGN